MLNGAWLLLYPWDALAEDATLISKAANPTKQQYNPHQNSA